MYSVLLTAVFSELERRVVILLWASAHRGKLGQLTPWKNG